MILLLGIALSANAVSQPLSASQRQVMAEAWRAGYHVGLPIIYTAVVYVESGFRCQTGDHGRAHGCAQLHQSAVKAVVGHELPAWRYTGSGFTEVGLAIGAQYLRMCMNRFGYPAGIGCYNQGLTRSLRLGKYRLSRLPYTRAVLRAVTWLRAVHPEEK